MINGFPLIHIWKDQNNLGEFPTNPSLLSDYLNSSLYGSLISFTPLGDQDRISPDNIVINSISTRHVIRMNKDVNKGITS